MADFPVSADLVYDGLSLLINNMLVPSILTAIIILFFIYLKQRRVMPILEIYPRVIFATLVIWFLIFMMFPNARVDIYFEIVKF